MCLVSVVFFNRSYFFPALDYLEGMMGGMCPEPAGRAAFLESVALWSAPEMNIPDLGPGVL